MSLALLGGEVALRVENGPGPPLAERDLERIFEPFIRGERVDRPGLGLAIARGFTEANGGRIWADVRRRVVCDFRSRSRSPSPGRPQA